MIQIIFEPDHPRSPLTLRDTEDITFQGSVGLPREIHLSRDEVKQLIWALQVSLGDSRWGTLSPPGCQV
jgi:hypothetical protein